MITDTNWTTARDTIHEQVDTGVIPGAVTLLDHGGNVHIDAYGVADLASGTPLREDALFRIQSMTKPVLAVATMQLVERGNLRLDDPVDRWLPELADRVVLRTPESELDDLVPAQRSITVDDLLTNRSGYGVVMSDTSMTRALEEHRVDVGPIPRLEPSDAWLSRLSRLPLIHQPGEGWRYHTSFDILGILLSRVSGTGLEDHLMEAIFDPLGMPDTAPCPSRTSPPPAATTSASRRSTSTTASSSPPCAITTASRRCSCAVVSSMAFGCSRPNPSPP
jgi:CubicO group peptidase (beta-lactamase class C family)